MTGAMPRKSPASAHSLDRVSRIAWLATFVLPLVLVALLYVAKVSHAPAAEVPPETATAIEEELEEDFDEESCVEVEEGLLECDGGEEAGAGPLPPEDCLLRTVSARVIAYPSRDTLRLVVRYTSSAPTKAYVDFGFKGGKGSFNLGLAKQRLSKRGLFHLDERLSESRMAQARAAKRFEVTLDLPEAPESCQRYFTKRLTIKKTAANQDVWLQSSPVFGA